MIKALITTFLLWAAHPPLHAQNRALDLDGRQSYIELPRDVFTNLTQATIEAWVKFNTQDQSRFYSYGGMNNDLCLGRTFLSERRIQFFINLASRLERLDVATDIRPGIWCHVAAVCGPDGMRLYYNGVLSATNNSPRSFSSLPLGGPHCIGAMNPIGQSATFNGQVDELRVWNIARSADQIRETMNRALTGNEPNLAALWNFDDPAQPGKDASPSGHHGKPIGTATTVPVNRALPETADASESNKVLDFDGTSSTYAELPQNIFNNLEDATVEGWVKWDAFSRYARFFDFGKPANLIGVYNYDTSSSITFEATADARLNQLTVPNHLRPGQWVHVATVCGSGGMKLYLNGALAATNSVRLNFKTIGNGRNLLGSSNFRDIPNHQDQPFRGQMDELRVWSVARTQSEILAGMGQRLTGREPNLFGLWNFDRTENGLILDSSTNANHGRLLGNAKCIDAPFPAGTLRTVTVAVFGRAKGLTDGDVWLEHAHQVVASERINARGSFRIVRELSPGEYDVCVQSLTQGARKTIQVSGSTQFEIDLEPDANLHFSGALTAYGERNPLAAVIVQALQIDAGGLEQLARTVCTSDTGEFSFTNLKPGNYRLRYQTASGFKYFNDGEIFAVGPGSPIRNLSARNGPFKKGLWRSFSSGMEQSSQAGQDLRSVATGGQSGAVLADPSGVVWWSTSFGVARFDGREMNMLTQDKNQLVNNRITALWREPSGVLWIGTAAGLTRWDGHATNFTTTNGLVAGQIRTITQTPNGTLWFGGDQGLSRYQDGQFIRYTATNGLPTLGVNKIAAGHDNALWIATDAGLIRFSDGTFVPVLANEIPDAQAVAVANDGTVWCGTSIGVWRLTVSPNPNEPAKVLSRISTFDGLIDDRVTALHESPDRALWIGTRGGLCRYDGVRFLNFSEKDGLPANTVVDIHSSSDGVIWVASANGAVGSYDPKTFQYYGIADGMTSPGLGQGVVAKDGTVWVGNWFPQGSQIGLYSIGSSGLTNHSITPPNSWITDVTQAPDGSIWILTQNGIVRFRQNDIRTFTRADGLQNEGSGTAEWDAEGRLWFKHANPGGITRYDGKRFESLQPPPGKSWPDRISRMRLFGTNQIWLAAPSGAWLYNGTNLTVFTSTNGLPSSDTSDFAAADDGSTLIATWGGIARFDGSKSTTNYLAARDGLSDNRVYEIFRDSRKIWWFATIGGGLSRWDGKVWSTLTTFDGLSGNGIRGIMEGPEGVYWISTEAGLTRYEPNKTKPNSPRLEIAAELDYGDRPNLPPIEIGQRVRFKFDTPDIRTRPETRRYRWMLAPGAFLASALPSTQWTDGSSATEFDRVFDQKGAYTVAVQYIDRDFNYSDPTVRHFSIYLPWQQNAWIIMPAGASIFGLFGTSLFFGFRYYTKRREAERLRDQMLDQERRARHALETKNAQLERARDLAESASRTKSTFLANMSHELRTPLTAIIGFTEILQSEVDASAKPEQAEDLNRIYDSAKHLLGLINGILDLSKIEAQKMELHLENFAIKPLVDDVAHMMKPLVEKKSNELAVVCPPDIGMMHADPVKVRQSLLNLLGNANKFTDNGRVTLSVARQGSQIQFAVSDTGIGMAPDQIAKLFQAFTQGESSTARKYGGTGLGLTITKHFAEMMGGTISVASEPGQGSTFTILLPDQVTAPSLPEPSGLPGDEKPVGQGQCLLVIDDDPNVHRLIERTLGPEGFVIRSALTGKDGLRLARELRPAVITLDVMMPHTDGWTVLSALKSDPDLCNIPVVMLSIVGDKELGFALGASDYLIKPVDRSQLLNTLERYLPERNGQHVLLVEDDVNIREMIRRMLQNEQVELLEAENGALGIESIKKRIPGLILLDLMMPVMDGFQVLAELHKNPDWRQIPVVVVTAKDLNEGDRLRIAGQAERIMQKGVLTKDDLVLEVRNLMKKSVTH